jgi:small ligand-binding sensory domain FIST
MYEGKGRPIARAAVVEDARWERALEQALKQVDLAGAREGDGSAEESPIDLLILFASGLYAESFPELVRCAYRLSGARLLIGCSGQGVIGPGQELEETPALALLALKLPQARLRPVRFTQALVEECESAEEWHTRLGLTGDEVNAWLIFADPFRMDCEALLEGLARAYPHAPMVGGLASAHPLLQRSFVFLNGEVFGEGGIALALGAPYSILPLVSQGCEPIGEPWTITSVRGNLVETISNRPAYELLLETIQELPPLLQRRARRNLLVGLAANEYRERFERGSFLVRPLIGVDRLSGGLAIGAMPRVGQTIQFQMRDAATADMDLRDRLEQVRAELGERQPIAAILCTCNGRGMNLFDMPNHDAEAVEHYLGSVPLAGFFCNGEIGPVDGRPFLHGFTACLALLLHCGCD